jgi:hypothetical protein
VFEEGGGGQLMNRCADADRLTSSADGADDSPAGGLPPAGPEHGADGADGHPCPVCVLPATAGHCPEECCGAAAAGQPACRPGGGPERCTAGRGQGEPGRHAGRGNGRSASQVGFRPHNIICHSA